MILSLAEFGQKLSKLIFRLHLRHGIRYPDPNRVGDLQLGRIDGHQCSAEMSIKIPFSDLFSSWTGIERNPGFCPVRQGQEEP